METFNIFRQVRQTDCDGNYFIWKSAPKKSMEMASQREWGYGRPLTDVFAYETEAFSKHFFFYYTLE